MSNHNSNLQDDLFEDLIKRFNNGDEGAWKFIMDSYQEQMITVGIHSQLSLQMDIDVAQAEDVTQEAWIITYGRCVEKDTEKKIRFEHIGQIIKWIRETQKFLLQNLRRKAATRYEKPMQENDNGETVLPHSVYEKKGTRPVEESLIKREESGWVWAIFDQMLGEFNEADQDIISRRLVLNEKSSVVAQAVRQPVDHVYRVTEQAKNKLKSYGQADDFFIQVAELVKSRSADE
ncbi:MAG: hypothetical protein Q9P01_01210 [Anaerolineae bacterium]|nr:hypothetical protein [Anaerolineae bacterium]MDQ7033482.1 hypothetical protein [Anaerolineae bacterium]